MRPDKRSQLSRSHSLAAFENACKRGWIAIAHGFPHLPYPQLGVEKQCLRSICANAALPIGETDAYAVVKESTEMLGAKVGDTSRGPQR
jgi:hypothetical protein